MVCSKDIGSLGEDLAVRHLMNKGYEIIARNFYCRYGEIDVIALSRDCMIFVEVKLRKSGAYGAPAEFVGKHKQERIKKTAWEFIETNNIPETNFRFDIIEITGSEEYKINHIENAFG